MDNNLLLIDSHVHFHDCFDIEEYLNNIFMNFSKAASIIDDSHSWIGILLLSEITGVNFFRTLLFSQGDKILNNFNLIKTEEEESFIITDGNDQKIVVISGKQIAVKEGVELLALCTSKDFQEHEDLGKAVMNVISADAIPVLPWGVGKWIGKKKDMIKNLIEENNNLKLFLCDNSGRLRFWAEPQLFKFAKSHNRFIFAGTDALPIPSEIRKTGSFGFYLKTELNLFKPSEDLKKIFNELTESPLTFGKLENPVKFLRNQLTMQLNKRKK